MHPEIKQTIIALATASPTREVCGFIYRTAELEAKVLACENVAENPAIEFQISDRDHIKVINLGVIMGVYHSHPTVEGFTAPDLGNAEVMGVPYYLYCISTASWHEYIPPTYRPSLEGRPFVLGFEDCYETIRLYHRTKGVYMGDYDRDRTLNLKDLILARFDHEGFERVEVESAQIGDVLMFQSDRLLSNHLGILVGPSKMLHHPMGGLSCTEQVSDRWLSRLVCVFRRKPG